MTEQSILNRFRGLHFEEGKLKEIKGHLYARDYASAFAPSFLETYAARFSPSRALAYTELMTSLQLHPHHVLCLGGGAGGEVVAAATLGALVIEAVDMALWEDVIEKIKAGLEGCSQIQYTRADLLRGVEVVNADLITLLFVTNELIAQSRPAATKLLLSFSRCQSGTLLLVAESAGSYSDLRIGEKLFPLHLFLDHIFAPEWETIAKDDARWFRVDAKLEHQIKLENMRYFFRLYKRR